MKNLNIITIFALIFLFIVNFLNINDEYVIVKSENSDIMSEFSPQKKQNYKTNFVNHNGIFLLLKEKKLNSKEKFLYRLGKRESGLNYDRANKFYYVGKYQFGRQALLDIGYSKTKINKIMKSLHLDTTDNRWKIDTTIFTPYDQEKAIERYMFNYENKYLNKILSKYENKYYRTFKNKKIYMTKAGILAAAHLGGPGSVKKYFSSNGRYNPSDAFGTSIEDYMKMFSDLKMNECFEYKPL